MKNNVKSARLAKSAGQKAADLLAVDKGLRAGRFKGLVARSNKKKTRS